MVGNKQRDLKTRTTTATRTLTEIFVVNICYSPAGRSVLGKTVLETEGTVFPNTDRPRPVNNIFIYF